jgi:molybdenum cofactor cytidylyltransferase
MKPPITGILLAAGASRRFGSNKLLYPLEDGVPMVVAATRRLLAALPRSIAVVDKPDSEVAALLRGESLDIVVNPDAGRGMGSSLARGVAATPVAAGWVIALADMPYIPVPVIRQVAGRLAAGASVVAPVYRGRRGHPVGFAARHASALMQLQGDAGARSVIDANTGSLEPVVVETATVVTDIDTPGDYEALQPAR